MPPPVQFILYRPVSPDHFAGVRNATNRTQVVMLCVLLWVTTLVVYWPVMHHDFVSYDDQDYVSANRTVQKGLTREGIIWAFTSTHSANWHPVTWLAHMLDCQLFGLRAGWHHLVNLLWHATNAVLLFMLLRSLTGADFRSFFVAGLFALHPLHVESVAWVAERKDLLSAFFGLLATWAYARYVQQSGRKDSTAKLKYLLAMTCFALGLMSKPMLVTLPFLWLLLDYWPLQRFINQPTKQTAWRVVREKLPFLGLSALSCVVTMMVQQKAMLYHRELSFGARAANAVVAYARYLGKTVWPENLVTPYPHPGHWPATSVAAATLLLLLLTCLALWNARRRPYVLVGWLWFVGVLIPVIGLVQVGVAAMADRYTYLPMVGLAIIVAWLGAEGCSHLKHSRLVAGGLMAMLLAACAARTRVQVHFWRDTATLFTHAAALSAKNWVAHYNLALLALDRYQTRQRSSVADQLVQLTSPSANAAPNPATAHDYLQEIVRHCRAALEARPGFADIYVTLAKALTELGRLDEARAQLETAIRFLPDNAEARQNLGEILHRQGHLPAAIAEYKAALKLKPDWAPLLNNLAWVLATDSHQTIRDGPEALRLAQAACELTGRTNLWYLDTLAAAHAEVRDFTNAIATAEAASQLASAAGNQAAVEVVTRHLNSYRRQKPVRVPPIAE